MGPICAGTTLMGGDQALPKRGVAPSFRPVRDPLFGPPQDAVVAQLVRAPVCGTGGRWFEPTQLYQRSKRIALPSIVTASAELSIFCIGWQEAADWMRALGSAGVARVLADVFYRTCRGVASISRIV